MPSDEDRHLYHRYTWPEMNEAIGRQPVILLPIGSTEDHGHHLPLDVDQFLVESVCREAGQRAPDKILVMPTINYGFNLHHFDFPGTIHIQGDTLIDFLVDVCKSVAYHGFRKIVIVNGHGSNAPFTEIAARRATMETESLVASVMYPDLGMDTYRQVRESHYPGGAGHACELETSLYLHLEPSRVQMDKALDDDTPQKKYIYVDLAGSGPVKFMDWWGRWSETGIIGEATIATEEKGRTIFESFVENMVGFVDEFREWPIAERKDQHTHPVQSSIRW